MFELIYVEDAVREHPRTQSILSRYPRSRIIPCSRYGEVFNRNAQDFRLQKQRPALILAEKHGETVLETPRGYGIGTDRNYYFSHLLNCVYDCRYCFLQGMYRSAHLVLFVNYELFFEGLEKIIEENSGEECTFFSGYDCDSLALEPLTHFAEEFIPFFEGRSESFLELRTKSTKIDSLLKREPLSNVVIAFSLSNEVVGEALEEDVPRLERRLDAARKLQEKGWPVGLRFDPLIYSDQWQQHYEQLFEKVFSTIRADQVHSVSLGSFRLPKSTYKKLDRLFPENPLFAFGLEERDGLVSYQDRLQEELESFCEEKILEHISRARFFPCDGKSRSE